MNAPRTESLPDLESLRCFVAAAERLHFARAARSVGLSPAAFSDRIRILEDRLGGVLFERTTRRVRLTPAGEHLVAHAQHCLDAAHRCTHLSDGAAGALPYELLLGTRYELGMSWLVPALDTLSAAAPERTVHLYFGNTPELLPGVVGGDVDAMVTSARVTQAGLAFIPLHREQYVFVATPALLSKRPLRRAVDARSHTLLDAHPDLPLFRYFLDARPGDEAWAFDKHAYLGTIAAIRARALLGAGVAVLPRYFVGADLRARRLVQVLPRTRMPHDWFRLVFRSGHPREQAIRALGAELSALPLR